MDSGGGGQVLQRGSLKVVKNRHGVKLWRAQWRENGSGRTRILGKYADMSRSEARAEFDKILAPLAAVTSRSRAQAVTVQAFVEHEYLIVKNRVWKDSTRATTEQIIRTHILDALGGRQITSITRRELQAHLDDKAAAGLSYSVVAHTHWQLVAIFNMAKGDGLVTVNPTDGLVTPKCQRETDKRVIAVLDIRRAQMVLGIRERLIFRLAVCEGMRPGEITGLQLGDLREDGIHVERRIYRGKVDTPKSWRSRRLIPTTEATALVLTAYRELLRDQNPSAWLFPSEKGTPLSYSGVYRRIIQPALKAIGMGDVNFQVLRRTWVTEFSESEKDPKVRAEIAGHSVDVHENEYRQPNVEASTRAMKKLGERLQ